VRDSETDSEKKCVSMYCTVRSNHRFLCYYQLLLLLLPMITTLPTYLDTLSVTATRLDGHRIRRSVRISHHLLILNQSLGREGKKARVRVRETNDGDDDDDDDDD
jgi:hypothetical protein